MSQLDQLVSSFGFRVSNLDAKSIGISERVLARAVGEGRAKVESAHFCGTSADGAVVVAYLVFA